MAEQTLFANSAATQKKPLIRPMAVRMFSSLAVFSALVFALPDSGECAGGACLVTAQHTVINDHTVGFSQQPTVASRSSTANASHRGSAMYSVLPSQTALTGL